MCHFCLYMEESVLRMKPTWVGLSRAVGVEGVLVYPCCGGHGFSLPPFVFQVDSQGGVRLLSGGVHIWCGAH